MIFSKVFLIQKRPIRNKTTMKKCKNMDNEIILNESNSGSVTSYQFVRVRCLFISCLGKKSPSSRFRTRMTRIARIFTDPCVSVSSAQSVFYFNPSAFICVHLRLIFVSLSDRTHKAVSADTNLPYDTFITNSSKRSASNT
jgi:hypothetical protein